MKQLRGTFLKMPIFATQGHNQHCHIVYIHFKNFHVWTTFLFYLKNYPEESSRRVISLLTQLFQFIFTQSNIAQLFYPPFCWQFSRSQSQPRVQSWPALRIGTTGTFWMSPVTMSQKRTLTPARTPTRIVTLSSKCTAMTKKKAPAWWTIEAPSTKSSL